MSPRVWCHRSENVPRLLISIRPPDLSSTERGCGLADDPATADAQGLGDSLGEKHGFRAMLMFDHGLKGIYIRSALPASAVAALQTNPNVKFSEPNVVLPVEDTLSQVVGDHLL